VVDDCNLRFQVRCARRALGPDGDLIKSVAGRGYFFLDESEGVSEASDRDTNTYARRPIPLPLPSSLPPDPAGVQSPEDYRASCELLRELLTSVLHDLWRLRGAGPIMDVTPDAVRGTGHRP
jgi:hypothetical protein